MVQTHLLGFGNELNLIFCWALTGDGDRARADERDGDGDGDDKTFGWEELRHELGDVVRAWHSCEDF